ncbi:hypothetical protein M885DRAFT_60868 [Pelagophyceae sp. CCMP2097]|nr:hypothetical protein M885DRAFT_60868 [Pelagophyceae sp. CCMP2097]
MLRLLGRHARFASSVRAAPPASAAQRCFLGVFPAALQERSAGHEKARTVAAQRGFSDVFPAALQERSAGHEKASARRAVATVVALVLGSVESADAAGEDNDSSPPVRAPIGAETFRRVSTGVSGEESDEESDSSLNEAPQPKKRLSKPAQKKAWKTPSGEEIKMPTFIPSKTTAGQRAKSSCRRTVMARGGGLSRRRRRPVP